MARNRQDSQGQYRHLLERPAFRYFIVFSIIATLAISAFSLYGVYQLKKTLVPEKIDTNDFLEKLTSHEEMKPYIGISPLNIVQINSNNFAGLQSQISGLDISYIGSFIVQYKEGIVVYDYENDIVKGTLAFEQQSPQLPADFFQKLNKHPELQGLQNEQPVGGQLDEASLATLKQQFPDVYANAKVGDFLLRYKSKLVIYDYISDRIVNAVNLQ
ncbi:hypothetical protein HYX08_05640 [Candidatus Woesearchaeota archaeon]|nr:hypothetical protein [Candidatus Woesearchaeota archaeon]